MVGRRIRMIGAGLGLLVTAGVAVATIARTVAIQQTVTTASLAPPSGVSSSHPSATTGQVNLSWTPSSSTIATSQSILSSASQAGPWSVLGTVSAATTTAADATAPYNGERYYKVRANRGGWTAETPIWSAHSRPMASGVNRVSGTGAGTALTGPWTTAGTNLAALAVSDATRYQPTAWPASPNTMFGAFYLDATHAWASGTGTIAAFDGSNWTTQTPGVTGNLEQIVFADANTGWSVGAGGAIVKTTNGGTTWTTQTSGTSRAIHDIDCVSTTACWAVASNGDVVATTNGGTTWTAQNPGTSQNLWDVDCVSTTTCWLVGGGGVIRKTTDGGANWVNQTPAGFNTRLRGLSCLDTLRCWATGDSGVLRRTTDGGTTWTVLNSGTTNVLRSIFMVNGSVGYLTGDGTTVKKTTDGGLTWTAQTVPAAAYQSASCISVTDCLIVSDLGVVLVTHDGGVTWGEQASRYVELTPLTPNLATGGGVATVVSRFVYRTTTVPGAGTRFILMASADNGTNWATFDLPTPAAVNTDVSASVDLMSLGFSPTSRVGTIKLRFAAVPQGGALTVQMDLAHLDVN